MSPRDWRFRLDDIEDALGAIQEYVSGMEYEDWIKDRKTTDAVIRNLEVIGGAAGNSSEDIQSELSILPSELFLNLKVFFTCNGSCTTRDDCRCHFPEDNFHYSYDCHLLLVQ